MSIFAIFTLGIITGLVISLGLTVIAKRRVERQITDDWQRRSGLRRRPDEPLEAFTKRCVPIVAERELEQEWGVPRHDSEALDDYLKRVARSNVEQELHVARWPVMGQRGEA